MTPTNQTSGCFRPPHPPPPPLKRKIVQREDNWQEKYTHKCLQSSCNSVKQTLEPKGVAPAPRPLAPSKESSNKDKIRKYTHKCLQIILQFGEAHTDYLRGSCATQQFLYSEISDCLEGHISHSAAEVSIKKLWLHANRTALTVEKKNKRVWGMLFSLFLQDGS